mmetsp:Transcript_17334/g.41586  ORF Transcript_17334/g.41586 Transcript_17334/m.41586 type:complete len:236 (+) Transcript_17334:1000-1707(+)
MAAMFFPRSVALVPHTCDPSGANDIRRKRLRLASSPGSSSSSSSICALPPPLPVPPPPPPALLRLLLRNTPLPLSILASRPHSPDALQTHTAGSSPLVATYLPAGSKATPLTVEVCISRPRILKGCRLCMCTDEDDDMPAVVSPHLSFAPSPPRTSYSFQTIMGWTLSRLHETRWLASGAHASPTTSRRCPLHIATRFQCSTSSLFESVLPPFVPTPTRLPLARLGALERAKMLT